MGLINALQFHFRSSDEEEIKEGFNYELSEFELISYGEIFRPFNGDREHSHQAKFITFDYPFKLFAITTPYSIIPQKISLEFKSPYEDKSDGRGVSHRGFFPGEIAKEFTAFMSLYTRRRIFVNKQIRANGFPIEKTARIYDQVHHQEPQQSIEINPQELEQLFKNLAFMNSKIAKGVMLSLRLYHSAIRTMYTEAEFSYLFLIMSLEAIASVVFSDYKLEGDEKKDEYLNSRFGGIIADLTDLSEEKQNSIKTKLLSSQHFISKKVFKFVDKYCPDKFYSEEIDGAKPNRGYSVIKEEGEFIERGEKKLNEFERFEKAELKKVLNNAYQMRSKFVHSGTRMSGTIIVGHFDRIPLKDIGEIQRAYSASLSNQINYNSYVPPLLTLERLVSYSIINFISSEGDKEK